jgi:hypothetical protein
MILVTRKYQKENQTMRKPLFSLLAALLFACAIPAADYFPASVGRTWEFDYGSYDGHSAGGVTDSGVIYWTITDIAAQGTAKVITIRQVRTLTRSIYLNAMFMEDAYDSSFNPPRILSEDEIQFIDSGNVLYRKSTDSRMVQVLVHDPKGTVPSSICTQDTLVTLLGSSRPATLVITGSCDRSYDNPGSPVKHETFDYFLLSDGIGPVMYRYDSRGSRLLSGGFFASDWTLRALPVGVRKSLVPNKQGLRGSEFSIGLLGFTPGALASTGHPQYIYDLHGRLIAADDGSGRALRAADLTKGIFITRSDKGVR